MGYPFNSCYDLPLQRTNFLEFTEYKRNGLITYDALADLSFFTLLDQSTHLHPKLIKMHFLRKVTFILVPITHFAMTAASGCEAGQSCESNPMDCPDLNCCTWSSGINCGSFVCEEISTVRIYSILCLRNELISSERRFFEERESVLPSALSFSVLIRVCLLNP